MKLLADKQTHKQTNAR